MTRFLGFLCWVVIGAAILLGLFIVVVNLSIPYSGE